MWVVVARGVQNEIDAFENGVLAPRFKWQSRHVAGSARVFRPRRRAGLLAMTVADPQHTPNVAVLSGDALRRITTEGDDLVDAHRASDRYAS